MGEATTLSHLEFDVLWEHLRLGLFPPVLTVASPGVTVGERAALRTEAWASLAARGLPDDRLARRLTRLARPEWEIDARLRLSAHAPRTSALAARVGRSVTVAVLDGDALALRATRPDQMVSETVRLLPGHPPGTGASVTLPGDVLDHAAARAGADRERFVRGLVSQGFGRDESRKLGDVLGGVVRHGSFGAARTPAGGGRRRASHVVSVFDTADGRYVAVRRNGWVTLLPGTEQALIRQLDELLDELTPHP